jgi:hypothetical protein
MPYALPLFGASNAWITPPVVVAVCALLFTVGSFWWIQARRGRLRAYGPHAYGGCLAGNKKLLILPLIIHNPAPAPLAVVNTRLLLSPIGGGETTFFYWHAIQTALTGVNETRVFASPFPVEGRRAVEKFLEFQCNRPEVRLDNGPYSAVVEVQVEPSWRRPPRWSRLVRFTLNTQLITEARGALLQRSNDPELMSEGRE